MNIHYLYKQRISSDQFSEIRDLLDDPRQHHTECVGKRDPDDGIKEGKAIEIDQKNAGEDDVREISCDFFEEHDTERDASEEDEAARP